MATTTTSPVYKVDASGNVVGTVAYPNNDSGPPPQVFATQVTVSGDTPVVQAVRAPQQQNIQHTNITISSGPVDPVYNLNDTEVIVFAYRTPVKYLAIIDLVFSIIYLGYGMTWILGLISILGPAFGIYGASSLVKVPAIIYFLFCVYGCIVDIYVMSIVVNFWTVFSFFVQLYITKIVGSFARALNHVSDERLHVLRQPGFLQHASYGGQEVRAVYY